MELRTRSYSSLENWHRKFAWFPVYCIDGKLVWLEFVERRCEDGEAKFDSDGFIPAYEYRRIT